MNRRYDAVASRAAHRCEYCHAPEAAFNLPFEVEQVVPCSRGGNDQSGNLALACRSCNLFKSNSTEAVDETTGRVAPLFHPRQDVWSEHFQIAESGVLSGRTEISRATIDQLRMNAPTQIAARQLWLRIGIYLA